MWAPMMFGVIAMVGVSSQVDLHSRIQGAASDDPTFLRLAAGKLLGVSPTRG